MNEVLSGHGLVKRFGPTVALAGVDLAVSPAEAVAIMGPSGSGKSTLLHCLAGIIKPDAGEVRLLGRRIDSLGERGRSVLRRTRFGFVFQFGQLLPELPADENVALPLMLGGTLRREAVAQARAWFGPLGLNGLEGRRPGELSGGQAQRVALARALVTRPAVVFADEPTGALDQATGHETMRLLVEATKHNGTSLVVVTHDPNVARWCDRTVEVRDGRLLLPGAAPTQPPTGPTNAHAQNPAAPTPSAAAMPGPGLPPASAPAWSTAAPAPGRSTGSPQDPASSPAPLSNAAVPGAASAPTAAPGTRTTPNPDGPPLPDAALPSVSASVSHAAAVPGVASVAASGSGASPNLGGSSLPDAAPLSAPTSLSAAVPDGMAASSPGAGTVSGGPPVSGAAVSGAATFSSATRVPGAVPGSGAASPGAT